VLTLDLFFERLGALDWLSVLAGTAAAMVLGTIWYGPLFGKLWARETGVPFSSTPDPARILSTAIYMLVLNVGIAWYGVVDDIEHALVMGLAIGVLLLVPALFSAVVWAKRSLAGFLIDAVHWFAIVVVCAFVQGLLL
jgi:hypothetical protein